MKRWNRLRAWRDIDLDDLLIVDADGKLVGMLGLAEVALAPPRRRLEGLIKAPPPRIHGVAPRDDVLAALDEGKIDTLPVVDGQDRLLGMIQHDAIVQAVREEATADLATLVGAGKEELALSPAMYAVRKRLPWLNINLVTAFAAASVVGLFENTIAQFTALAVLLPVVAGQSGNTGAQALAVIIRGLALRRDSYPSLDPRSHQGSHRRSREWRGYRRGHCHRCLLVEQVAGALPGDFPGDDSVYGDRRSLRRGHSIVAHGPADRTRPSRDRLF